jgi:hypothetical protein
MRTCCDIDYVNKVTNLLCINSEPCVCAFTSKLPAEDWPYDVPFSLKSKGIYTKKLHVDNEQLSQASCMVQETYSVPCEESAWNSCRPLGTGRVVKYRPLSCHVGGVSPKFPHSCINQSITFETLWYDLLLVPVDQ